MNALTNVFTACQDGHMTTETMTISDMDNNESVAVGYWYDGDNGVYRALVRTTSKSFKTERGAVVWLARFGYAADGTRA